MMERIGETSPRLEARITGAFYILTILAGIFVRFFRGWNGLQVSFTCSPRISKQQKSNLMFRRTHGTPY
jgi:hypothetical protein